MTIAVFTTSLSLGGITSYLIHFVNYLCSQGHKVTVFYTSSSDGKESSFDSRIKLVRFDPPNMKSFRFVLGSVFSGGALAMLKIKFRNRDEIVPAKYNQKLAYLRAEQTRPFDGRFDVAISSAEFYCNYLVKLKVSAAKKVAWVHPDLSSLDIDKELSRRVLKTFDAVCVVSDSCYLSFTKIFPEFSEKTHVIENIIDQAEISEKAERTVDDWLPPDCEFKIVTVCRFDNSSKRLDRIIETCKLLKSKRISFVWNLIGSGPDEKYIQKLADSADVLDVVRFFGPKTNPYPYIAKSDVFVLSSQYEGKPIVVDEALGLHVPCIVSNYKSAKRQVLCGYGAVIDNDDSLFPESFARVLTKDNLSKWKDGLSSYTVDNDYIKEKIDKLVGE